MNTRLNLLPWRAARRQRRWRSSLLALGLSIMAGGLGWWRLDAMVEASLHVQRQQHQALTRQWAELEARIAAFEHQAQRQRAEARTRARLERERLSFVHLLDALARHTPAGVVLSEVQQREDRLDLIAHATSSARITQTVQQWGGSGADAPVLTSIKAERAGGYAFTLLLPWTDSGEPGLTPLEHAR